MKRKGVIRLEFRFNHTPSHLSEVARIDKLLKRSLESPPSGR